ncbi:SWIM zinc finger family protein [Halobium salinum]|uniref:SWIM zinc finger family protein n=1 Tax=Halobium salinum TaxID=1364940 RepID=A0ABD5P862_9EURY|nr:SWIM zinc finger family protein [Halobium salinum]
MSQHSTDGDHDSRDAHQHRGNGKPRDGDRTRDTPTLPSYLDDLLDERDCRALTETMFLDEAAPDLYRVRTASGGDYRVDRREPACTCPDFQYRETRCKHIRRVELETGDRDAAAVSRAVDRAVDRVDDRIAELAAHRAELRSLQAAAEAFGAR